MVKYLKPGEDFGADHFSKDFGFSNSRHDARNHPADAGDDEYGDGSYVQRLARGGQPRRGYAMGGAPVAMPVQRAPVAPRPAVAPGAAPGAGSGMMSHATITMPVSDAVQGTAKMLQAGRAIGARQTVGALAQAAHPGPPAPMGGPPGATASLAAAPPAPPAQQGIPQMARGGHLTARARKALPKGDFALPGGRYPIEDASHARNALARVSGNGSPDEKARVRSAVHRKYPDIGKK